MSIVLEKAPPVPDDAHLSSLLRRAAAGDRAAFTELHDLLAPGIYESVRLVLPCPDIAAAVTAATLVEAWTLSRFRREAAVADWIGGIAARRACERLAGLRAARGDLAAIGATHDEMALKFLVGV